MTSQELQKYLEFARELAREAGAIVRQAADDAALHITSKGDSSPVTAADEAINALVIRRVKETYPHIGVLGEEESSNADGANGLLWVCDPIDGTIPFVLGVPISTFCLALVDDGVPVVGVVYHFSKDVLYSAAKGLGAFCNDEQMPAPANEPLPIIPLETWHGELPEVAVLRQKLYAAKYQTPNFTSCAFESVQVARGRLTGVLYGGDKPWDIAAQFPILTELGFSIVNLQGKAQRYDGPIKGAFIGRPGLFEEIFG